MRKTIKNFMYIKRKETAIMMIVVAIAIIAGMVLGFFVSMGEDETVQLGMMIASDDEWVDETEWDNMFMEMKKERENDSE